MKLEKVSDNQIRCTLTKEDLQARGIKISEIAYGSIKAKMLFKDVMQQASYEFGFEAENIPLMIEAIPMSTGCIVFIITKVENPEELDTRFSRFSPSIHSDEGGEDSEDMDESDDGGFMIDRENFGDKLTDVSDEGDALSKLMSQLGSKLDKIREENSTESNPFVDGFKTFVFDSLDNVGQAARILKPIFFGKSSLYKNTEDGKFYLLLERRYTDKKEFLRICNLMLEYGSFKKTTDATVAYMKEHYKLLIQDNAIEGMSQF